MDNINMDLFKVDEQLNLWLTKNFDYVYKHNGFYIVANNVTPLYSLGVTGENVWEEMKKVVNNLMIKNDTVEGKQFYNKLKRHYILAYGESQFLNIAYDSIFVNFGRKIIPIHNNDMLYFTYINNDIFISKLNNITWIPYGANKTYNKIIEVVVKIIFDTMNLLKKEVWGYEESSNINIILERDVNNGYEIPIHYEIEKKLKNYLYQIWLIYINKKTDILTPDQKKIASLFEKFKIYIPQKIENKTVIDVSTLYKYPQDTETIENMYIYIIIIGCIVIVLAFIAGLIYYKNN